MNASRNNLRHPLAAIGAFAAAFGVLLFGFLLVLDFSSRSDNPYTALATFVLAPTIVVAGLALVLLSLWMQARAARRRGEKFTFQFTLDATSPRYRRNLLAFGGVSLALVAVIAYTGVKAHQVVDSTAFCGQACHQVMGPQYTAYHNSAHARVACVDCHVGPGFEHAVRAKIAGMRQLYAVAFDTYERPIPTPVRDLRPAQETCENCHWPRQFYGEKLVSHTYYTTDEENTPWTIGMLVKIGGGNPLKGKLEGIHWHMLEGNTIEYIAVDEKFQDIAWVRVTHHDGRVDTYTQAPESGGEIPDPNAPDARIRRFDCVDCHNRPSHVFQPPAKVVNLAMSQGRIATDLPYIRAQGVELLMAEYASHDDAAAGIPKALDAYYRKDYPDVAQARKGEIERAAAALVDIYRENFFPEMKTDYRTSLSNLSHFTNRGCFRCHNGVLETGEGRKLERNCTSCHAIVAQGPSANLGELERDVLGLEFEHPVEIGEAWKEMDCISCHTHDSGY